MHDAVRVCQERQDFGQVYLGSGDDIGLKSGELQYVAKCTENET